jgi:hypothetical protein
VPKQVLNTEQLTEKLMRELNLQDRASLILQVIDAVHENDALLAVLVSQDDRFAEMTAQSTAHALAEAIRGLKYKK